MSQNDAIHPAAPPPRPDDSHKGTYGTVVIVGGCRHMPGAPALAATAACRSGVGLVKIAAEAEVLAMSLLIQPSATGVILDAQTPLDVALQQTDADAQAVLAVGPGIGSSDEARDRVAAALQGPRHVVLDADGLNLLAASDDAGKWVHANGDRSLVLTPHPGEFRRLAERFPVGASPVDEEQRPFAAKQLASATDAIVVLKGRGTVVSDGQRCYVNDTGNPALATAGSGDVLTGLIAALVAQGMAAFDAAVLGVYLHGLAADRWAQGHGRSGMIAMDLADELPDTFEHHRDAHESFGFSAGEQG